MIFRTNFACANLVLSTIVAFTPLFDDRWHHQHVHGLCHNNPYQPLVVGGDIQQTRPGTRVLILEAFAYG